MGRDSGWVIPTTEVTSVSGAVAIRGRPQGNGQIPHTHWMKDLASLQMD
jgi:hypothetical protein